MNVTYRNQSYAVDPCSLIVRGDTLFARLQLDTRVPMTVYVKVTAPVAVSWIPTWERTPFALTIYTPPALVLDFKAVWLGLANAILEQARQKLDIRIVIAESEMRCDHDRFSA